MNLKQYILFAAAMISVSMFAQKTASVPKTKPFTVVIDAGHGGHDPGALGKITQEKKLNLDVSLLVGKMIEEEYPEVNVRFTRKTDVFLTLQERANFVNKNNADLFICIHTNASESSAAVGAETFVLGIDKMASNLTVAMRENAVMLLEDNYETTYQGFDPNSIDSYIMFELMQDQYIDQSLQFATLVQQQFSGSLKRADRGVRQAGFWVLHKSACPSVLIEMGFISNHDEEIYLASIAGKEQIATAIYNAFVCYKNALDKKTDKSSQITPKGLKEYKKESKSEAPKDTTTVKAEQLDSVTPKFEKERLFFAQQSRSSEYTKKERATDSLANSSVPAADSVEAKPAPKTVLPEEKVTPSAKPAAKNSEALTKKPVYRVQIFAAGKVIKPGDASFKGLKNCRYTRDGNYFKYTYGEETDYQKALELQKKVKAKFPDCFIVAFLDGKQILVKDARKM